MKMTKKAPVVLGSALAVFAMTACGSSQVNNHLFHVDYAGYSYTEVNEDRSNGKTFNGTWAETYDKAMADSKIQSGVQRYETLHRAEDILMSTGAICPIYNYTDLYMKKADKKNFFASPLGYKYFQKVGGELTLCVGPKADNIDPALNSAVDGAILINHVFEGLMTWDFDGEGKPAKLNYGVATGAAKTVDPESGAATWVFQIDPEAKFSDGTQVKPSDFAWSWARAASGKLGADYGYMFDVIKGYEETAADTDKITMLSGVKANDSEGTLTVELIANPAYFEELVAFPTYAPLKQAVVEADENGWWTKAATYIGNGPMKVETLDNTDAGKIVMVPNTFYNKKASVATTKITFSLLDDDATILAKYENGDFCFIDSVPNDQISTLKTKYNYGKDNAEFFVAGQLGTYYVIFNVNDARFGDVCKSEEQLSYLRRGLGLLIDRNYICESIGQAGQTPANGFVASGITETDPVTGETVDWTTRNGVNRDGEGYYSVAKEALKTNRQKGITLIEKAGYTFDRSTGKFTNVPTLTYLTNAGTGHIAIAEYLQATFKLVGIPMEVESQEWATFLNTRKDGNYSIARNGWLADYNDPCSFLDMWTTNSGNNDAQFGKGTSAWAESK